MNVSNEFKVLEIQLNIAFNLDDHGGEIRKLVDNIDNLKLEIYPNEHPPPHFHVRSNDFNVSISIEDCEVLKGRLSSKYFKKIKYFHEHNKDRLIKIWNQLRPSDCPVGPIA